MNKHNGRRKAQRRHQKGRGGAAPTVASAAGVSTPSTRVDPKVPQQPSKHQPAAQRGGWRARGSAALGVVDWPAIAILVVPLCVMAVLDLRWPASRHVSGHPAPASAVSIRVPPEVMPPWYGDLALEAMPVVPDTRIRMALADAEPSPTPWHGDLTVEAMPVVPDIRSHAATPPGESTVLAAPAAPVTGRTDVATAPAPVCLPTQPGVLSAFPPGDPDVTARHPAAFGVALAAAARAQADDFVIYNPRYVTLAYPRGDTQPLYGVCTDVVVRAYRAFGIDFQELIHTSRLGRGDPSIDHRRVEVIRRFLQRFGTSFEISEFPEDFLAGDIVTYQRPQGRVSQHHIAVVSDQMAPSGRPLIVHNRGWGPQLEDALFVDRITGHYRFSPADAEAFERSRQPRATGRRRSSTVSLANSR